VLAAATAATGGVGTVFLLGRSVALAATVSANSAVVVVIKVFILYFPFSDVWLYHRQQFLSNYFSTNIIINIC
jgi:hypothetical protein